MKTTCTPDFRKFMLDWAEELRAEYCPEATCACLNCDAALKGEVTEARVSFWFHVSIGDESANCLRGVGSGDTPEKAASAAAKHIRSKQALRQIVPRKAPVI